MLKHSAFRGLHQDLIFMDSSPGSRSMDLTSIRCLINSISRFIHLFTSSTLKTLPTQKNYRDLVPLLKHLKLLLDNYVNCKVPADVNLYKECEELDIAVNEAREFLEKWSPKMSKILCVLRSEPLVLKIQNSFQKISQILCRSSEPLACFKDLSGAQFMQKFECIKLEKVSVPLEEVLGSQIEGRSFCSDHLVPMIESLKLASSQELLNERIALEKERIKAQEDVLNGDSDQINHIINFLPQIRDCMMKLESFNSINGIKIPPYFQCPLSLELMLDPVIVASGQTYERASIQRWLDEGLNICPLTHQKLSHTNLTPNYTVKALITNWCEENKVKLLKTPECSNSMSTSPHLGNVYHEKIVQCTDSQNGNSMPGSSVEVGHDSHKKLSITDRSDGEEVPLSQSREGEKSDNSSTHSYVHSRSESTSSAVSSIDYVPSASPDVSRISCDNASDGSGDITSDSSASVVNKNPGYSSSSLARQYHSSKTMAEMATTGNHIPSRILSFPAELRFNNLTTTSHVEKLVKDLKGQSYELQTAAAAELRFLAKHNTENRIIMGNCGVITPLIELLHSDVKPIQEHAVTALLNMSIDKNIKTMIGQSGSLEPLIHVLRTGNEGAKENAAACLFSLSILEEYRVKIGRSGAVKALVDLLGSGTIRGKKDAATALFNLSIFHENKARIVQAGAVKHLVELLDPEREMVDKAVAILANLSTISEGSSAIAREGGIPLLVEIVESGTQRGKENASSILLQLCINNSKHCRLVLQEGAVPPLVALSQSGTPRAKEKAQQLLSRFRTLREGATGKGKS